MLNKVFYKGRVHLKVLTLSLLIEKVPVLYTLHKKIVVKYVQEDR